MKIVADDKIPFLKGVLEPYADVVYLPGRSIGKDIIEDADALIIRTRTRCDGKLLEGTRIKFIGTATIGFDHIDAAYCDRRNIAWTNAPGCNSSSVQQYIGGAITKIASVSGSELRNRTLGIIGVGNVGSKVEKLARSIGMNVLLNDPPRERNEPDKEFQKLDTVLAESDIISLHVPLNIKGIDATWHMLDESSIKKVKKEAWIINSSRGEVTDSEALKKALLSGRISGAVLDVWENEPDIDLELMNLSLISTAHIAGYSTDGKANGTSMVVRSLSKFFGLPLNDWYPENIPEPSVPVFALDCAGKSEVEIIREAILHSYDIDKDSEKLRQFPSDFEKLRGDYPIRREFPSYEIILQNGTSKISSMLQMIGFKVSSL